MKLSACVIAKNEEKNLPDCLRSLQTIVDEMIVIDTGSIDDTIVVAQQFGARVYRYAWHDDFAAAKNFAIEKATGDWIVFLDADEYFTSETIGNVRNIVMEHAKECDAYLLKMINVDADRNNKPLDDFYATRIFRNSSELRFFGRIHEELRYINGRKKALYRVEEKDILLYHTGYSTQRMQLKCERNLKILLNEFEKNPRDTDLYRYLADAYHGLKDFKNAIKYAKLDIETGKKEISYASRSYRIMNNALLKVHAPKAQIAYYLRKSIEKFPELPDFYAQYALLKYNSQEYEEAFQLLTEAMTLHENYHGMETSLFFDKLSLSYLILGLLHQRKHQSKEALEYYQKALTIDKLYPEAFTALFQLIQNQEVAYVIGFLNTLYEVQEQKDLEFLVTHIGNMQKGKIYQYYQRRLQEILSTENKQIYTYEQRRMFVFLVLSAILMEQSDNLQQFDGSLPDPYQNILYRYYDRMEKNLNESDFNVYKTILLELLLTEEETGLCRYVMLARDFSNKRVLELAQLLQEKGQFLEAFNLYTHITVDIADIHKPQIYAQLGFCAYQMKKYGNSKDYFHQALDMGYQGNDLKEFLVWSVEKS